MKIEIDVIFSAEVPDDTNLDEICVYLKNREVAVASTITNQTISTTDVYSTTNVLDVTEE